MTSAGHTLADVGRTLSWGALSHFCRYLPPTSQLGKELDGKSAEMAAWLDGSLVAPLMAALIDSENFGRWEYAASVSRRKPKKPKQIKTPWSTKDEEQKLGSDPIPVGDFEDWWNGIDRQDQESG